MSAVTGATLVIAGWLAGPGTSERFYDEYEPHWTRILAHLCRNVRAAGTIRLVGGDQSPPRPDSVVTFEVIADDTRLVRREVTVWADGQPPEEAVTVVTPDQAVMFRRAIGSTAGWGLAVRHVPWQRATWQQPVGYAGGYYDMLCGPGLSRLVVWPYIGRGPNAYQQPPLVGDALRVFRRPHPGPDRTEVFMRLGGPSDTEFAYSLRDDWLVSRSARGPPPPRADPR